MAKTDKLPKPPTEKQYREQAIGLAFSYAPHIYPCRHCKWPVVQGYVCTYCGADDPR